MQILLNNRQKNRIEMADHIVNDAAYEDFERLDKATSEVLTKARCKRINHSDKIAIKQEGDKRLLLGFTTNVNLTRSLHPQYHY